MEILLVVASSYLCVFSVIIFLQDPSEKINYLLVGSMYIGAILVGVNIQLWFVKGHIVKWYENGAQTNDIVVHLYEIPTRFSKLLKENGHQIDKWQWKEFIETPYLFPLKW